MKPTIALLTNNFNEFNQSGTFIMFCSDRICEQFKTQFCLFSQDNDVKCIIEEDTYVIIYLSIIMLLVLNASLEVISQGQYGCDHQSRLEKDKDNYLIYYLNDSHHEYSIQLSIKINLIPVILQKPKEDNSGIDLIHLGYISFPIDNSDPDALFQKVLTEIQDQKQVINIHNKYQNIFFTHYKED